MNKKALLVVGSVATAGLVATTRKSGDESFGRSWMGRNARLARMGAKVGSTYAGTAARKTFASTERRVELDRAREFTTAKQVADDWNRLSQLFQNRSNS